jgi:tail lysozyme
VTVPQVQITARNHYLALPDPLPLNGAIAVPAVLYRESGLRPGSQGVQSTEHGGILNPNGAYGIASWNGPRQGDLKDFCDKRGLPYNTLGPQLDFVLHEMANSYPLSWAAVRSAAQFVSIIRTIVEDYERPRDPEPEIADAIRIATALAAVPLPVPGAPRPLPPLPAPRVPPAIPTGPTPFPGLPPITGDAAGRIIAVAEFLHHARDARISELIATDPEIVAYDAMLAGLGNVASPTSPPPLAIPAPAATQGTQMSFNVPPFIRSAAKNWVTSLGGTFAGSPAVLDIIEHVGSAGGVNWSNDLPGLGMFILGLASKDGWVTGGTVPATDEAKSRV